MLVCHIHTGKDEDGADKEIDGDLLGKYQPGENDGDDGIQINIIGGNDGP